MALTKKTYVDGETKITADNLNAIQDEIIANASTIASANTKANDAQQVANDALSNAEEAKQAAENALSDADNALNVAQEAKELAESVNSSVALAMIPQPTSGAEYAGKTLCVIGDSVTAGVGVTKGETDYGTLVGNAFGMTVNNQGASGTVLCQGGHRSCNIGKLTVANCSVPIVTILMGVNDWDQAVKDGYFGGTYNESYATKNNGTYYTLGELGSDDTSTIYGAVRMWCEKILELKQNEAVKDTKFFFMTPLITSWNNSVGSSKSWDQSKTNVHGFTFRDLCNAIIETCAVYQIPCIDMNKYSGIYWNSAEDTNTATVGGDGIHPNVAGHQLIADALIDYIKLNPTYVEESAVSDYILQGVSDFLGNKLTYPVKTSAEFVPLTGLALNASTTALTVGEKVTITPVFTPSNSTQKTITWESSDSNIATVDNGVVTAISEGDVTITCTPVSATSLAQTITFNVSASTSTDLTQIVLSDTTATVEQGDTKTITATLVPSNTTQTNIEWTSSDNTIATVVGNGLSCVVTAVNVGQCYITAKSTDNTAISAQCFFTTSEASASGDSYDVLLSDSASYDTSTQTLTSTKTGTANWLTNEGRANALINEPITNGMEVEIETFSQKGSAYNADGKADWGILSYGFTTTNTIDGILTTTGTYTLPVGNVSIYQDQPTTANGQAQMIQPNVALKKINLGVYFTDSATVHKVIFRKNTDGTISFKIADNDWKSFSDITYVANLTEYQSAVSANTLYFFVSGFGLTQVKVNYIGAIRN